MADLMDAVMQNNRQVAGNIDAWGALYDNAKVADAMVKANPDLVQRMGFQDAKQFHTLSAQDKIAATTGYIKQQGVQEFQTRQQLALAQIQNYNTEADYRTQQAADDQTAGTFLGNYLSSTAATPAEKMAEAAKKTPNMSGRILPKVVESLARWQSATTDPNKTDPEDLTTSFVSDPVTGAHFATRGKQILPAGYDTSKVKEEGPVYSPDGRMFWNGKGWAQLSELGFPEGSTIKTIAGVNAVVGKDGRILKTIGTQSSGQALADVLQGGNKPTPAAAKVVTPDIAKEYLQKAGGDKAKARKMATDDGYTF